MAGCQRVFHCAAMVSFHPKDAETMMLINRDATAWWSMPCSTPAWRSWCI